MKEYLFYPILRFCDRKVLLLHYCYVHQEVLLSLMYDIMYTFRSDNHNSAELLGSFPTKSTPVTYLNYRSHNILQAAGAV